jgi:hypothetical protein
MQAGSNPETALFGGGACTAALKICLTLTVQYIIIKRSLKITFLFKTPGTKNVQIFCEEFMVLKNIVLKGTVARDFQPSVIFINEPHLGP